MPRRRIGDDSDGHRSLWPHEPHQTRFCANPDRIVVGYIYPMNTIEQT